MKRWMLLLLALCLTLSLSSALLLSVGAEPSELPSQPASEQSSETQPPVNPSEPEASSSSSSDGLLPVPSEDISEDQPSESSSSESEGSLPAVSEESGSVSIDWGEISEEISYAPSRNYHLNVVSGKGGKVNRQVNGIYAPNEMVKLSAEADEGFVFSRWKSTGGVIANAFSAQTEFYMPVGDAKVEAVFVKKGEESQAEPEGQQEETVSSEKKFRVPYKLTYSILGLTVFTAAALTVFILVYRKKRQK